VTVPRRKLGNQAKAARARPSRSRQGRAGPGHGIRKTPLPTPPTGLRLYTADGARKYVTASEREAFLREAEKADRLVRTLCMTLAYAGSRLSEALALTADRVDLAAGVLVFETLKKRQVGIYRAVPIPPALLMRSTWCTASASCTPVVARDAG
jgi:integrase/recombinase XerD